MPDKPPITVPTPPESLAAGKNEHAYRHRKAQEARKKPSATMTTPAVVPSSPNLPVLPLELPIPTATTVSFLPDSTIARKCDSFVIDNGAPAGARSLVPSSGRAGPLSGADGRWAGVVLSGSRIWELVGIGRQFRDGGSPSAQAPSGHSCPVPTS